MVEEVWQFAKDHLIFLSFITLGVLVVLASWEIEVLGFGELDPIEGTSGCSVACYSHAYGSLCINLKEPSLCGGSQHMQVIYRHGRWFCSGMV